eukprot:Partr_v1_DN26205_c0_g1_i1_m48174 putative ABC transporter
MDKSIEISSATDYLFLPFRGLFDFADKSKTEPPPPNLGDAVCLVGKDVTPVVLSMNYSCPLHFYCPNSQHPSLDPMSLPSVCPPTLECAVQRLAAHFCPPQGLYEPVPCPRGFYCPDYSTKLICPPGHFCPTGTVDPRPCFQPFSICPEGSAYQTYYGGLLLCVLIDALLIILYSVLRCRGSMKERRLSREQSRKESGRAIATISETTHSRKRAQFVTLDGVDGDTILDSNSLRNYRGSPLNPTYLMRRCRQLFNTSPATFFNRVESPLDVELCASSPRPSIDGDHSPIEDVLGDRRASLKLRRSSNSTSIRRPQKRTSQALIKPFSIFIQELLLGYRRAQDGQDLSLNFAFDGLSVRLPSGRTILNGVTGEIVPGRVTVIMGPSGAGKSTLMNVLMGKIDRTGGRLLINGREVETRLYKKIVGYVPQDDNMLMELTVKENIHYSAKTRLPRSWSAREKEKFVDAVLEALDLMHVADNLISSISGGQRKRCNIGMELVTCPSAIFLDEPTSGLDSTAALKVAHTMKKIATDIGISVVAVVHQPRFEIFEEFDDFLMVAPGGFTAFQGQRMDVVPYFSSLGFYFAQRNNPADTLMDIIGGKGQKIPEEFRNADNVPALVENGLFEFEEYEVSELVKNWRAIQDLNIVPKISVESFPRYNAEESTVICEEEDTKNNSTCATPKKDSHSMDTAQIIAERLSHRMHKRSVLSLTDTNSQSSESSLQLESHRRLEQACLRRGCGPLMLTVHVYNRSLVQQYRLINGFLLELFVAIVCGTLIGLAVSVYEGALYQGLVIRPFTLISPSPIEIVVPILALIQACAIGLTAAPGGVKIFSEEREIYFREVASGLNPFSYYVGKNMASSYRFFITALHYSSLFHFFARPNTPFLHMFAIHFCTFFAVYGMSFASAMLVKRENASMIAVCVALVNSVLSGSGPSITEMKKVHLEWVLDISYARWMAEAWYSEELLIFENVYEIWDVSSATFGYMLDRFYFDLAMILLIGFALRVLGFILLVGTNRKRQR